MSGQETMKLKKQTIYGLIIAFVFPILIVFVSWRTGAVQDVRFVIDEVIAATAAWLVGAGLLIVVHSVIGKEGIIETHDDIIKIPKSKQASWIQRHRIFVKKDKRADFWLTMFMVVVFSVVSIMVAITFPTVDSSTNVTLISNLIKGSLIASGTGFLFLFVVLSGNEAYNLWDSKQKIINEQKNALLLIYTGFEDSFRNLKQSNQQKTKERLLEDFQIKLRNLCYDYPWNEKKREAILEVLNYLPEKLADNPNVNFYLLFLGFILARDSEHTLF